MFSGISGTLANEMMLLNVTGPWVYTECSVVKYKRRKKFNFYKKLNMCIKSLFMWLNYSNLGDFPFRKYNHFPRYIKNYLLLIMYCVVP